eukprot:COSAG01_NODE_65570_length_273_cov_0.551724_1_plen_66_part_01
MQRAFHAGETSVVAVPLAHSMCFLFSGGHAHLAHSVSSYPARPPAHRLHGCISTAQCQVQRFHLRL